MPQQGVRNSKSYTTVFCVKNSMQKLHYEQKSGVVNQWLTFPGLVIPGDINGVVRPIIKSISSSKRLHKTV